MDSERMGAVREVALVDRLREFGDVFASTLRKMRRPQLYLPSVLFFIALQMFSLGILGSVLGVMRGGSPDLVRQWGSRYGGLLSVLALSTLFCAPAAISGMAVMAGVAVERDGGGFSDFRRGLGTYYGRVIGAYALAALAFIAFAIPLGGLTVSDVAGNEVDWGQGLLLNSGNLVGAYFFTPWIAAAVTDGTGVMSSIARGVKFAWKNPYLLVPGFALQRIGNYLCDWLFQVDVSAGWTQGATAVRPTWVVSGLVSGAIAGYLYMSFLVLYISMYRLKAAPLALPETPEATSAGSVPPLDPDQDPEQ